MAATGFSTLGRVIGTQLLLLAITLGYTVVFLPYLVLVRYVEGAVQPFPSAVTVLLFMRPLFEELIVFNVYTIYEVFIFIHIIYDLCNS